MEEFSLRMLNDMQKSDVFNVYIIIGLIIIYIMTCTSAGFIINLMNNLKYKVYDSELVIKSFVWPFLVIKFIIIKIYKKYMLFKLKLAKKREK